MIKKYSLWLYGQTKYSPLDWFELMEYNLVNIDKLIEYYLCKNDTNMLRALSTNYIINSKLIEMDILIKPKKNDDYAKSINKYDLIDIIGYDNFCKIYNDKIEY